MRKVLFVFSILLTQFATAQGWQKPVSKNPFAPKSKALDKENVILGGNFGLFFGSVTYVDVSPFAGYCFNEHLMAGVGASYIYYRERFPNNYIFQDHMWGGRVFGRIFPVEQIFLHAEYELLNRSYYDFLMDTETRIWFASPLAGAGYFQGSPDGNGFSTFVLLALNRQDPRSPYYGTPLIFRVGYQFGL